MAPLKPQTEVRYSRTVSVFREFLLGNIAPEGLPVEVISEFKGLVNRCLRQDQWDWFTVYSRFSEPDPRDLRRVSCFLPTLRDSIRTGQWALASQLRQQLIDSYLLTCCHAFLGDLAGAMIRPASGGYIYILSTRDAPHILKIGMTTRSVADRVKEINSATGLLVPFSPRRVFRVRDQAKAERELFAELAAFRIRPDREFFQLPFAEAVNIVEQYLHREDMLYRCAGTIKWFSTEKGYGFIGVDDGDDVFVHVSEVSKNDCDKIVTGARVEFELGHRPQGPCARNVRVVLR